MVANGEMIRLTTRNDPCIHGHAKFLCATFAKFRSTHHLIPRPSKAIADLA